MPTYSFTVVQFLIPRSVADAMDAEAIAEMARASDAPTHRCELSTKSVPPTMARVTCHRALVPHLMEEFAAISARSTGQLVLECAAAGIAAERATTTSPVA